MKWILLLFAVLIVGATIAHQVQFDPGYVLLSYGVWTVEMSLALAGLLITFAFLILYTVLTSFSSILALPDKTRAWFFQRRENKANEALRQGLIAHTEGKWQHAEHALVAQAKKSPHPTVHYLAAARAAHAQGANDRAEQYLKKARERAPGGDMMIDITQAELFIEQKRFDESLRLLQQLHAKAPKNEQVLGLLAKVYQEQNLWKELAKIMGELKKYKVWPEEKLHHLELRAASGILRSAQIENLDMLVRQWDHLSKDVRRDTNAISAYCEQLIKFGGSDQAEPLIRNAINDHWEKRLVQIYGALEVSDANKQLGIAEKWLREHPQDPMLLFTLGRICLRNKLWGKARDYLENSLRLEKNAEAYHTLALLLEQMNEPEKAADCFRKGLEVSAHQVLEYFPRRNPSGSRILRQH